jgi:hypothetical protein
VLGRAVEEDVSDDAVLEALLRAKARVGRGWIKWSYRNGDDVCALGAIGAHSGVAYPMFLDCEMYLHRALAAVGTRARGLGIGGFNDWPSVEQRHVLGLFDWAMQLRRIDLARGDK